MNKLKSFFKVLYSLVFPRKAKPYFVGFTTLKAIGFAISTVFIFWIIFLVFQFGVLFSFVTRDSTIATIEKASDSIFTGIRKVVKEAPVEYIYIDKINSKVYMLSEYTPTQLQFYADTSCNFDAWADLDIAYNKNIMFVVCSADTQYIKDVQSLDYVNYQPVATLTIKMPDKQQLLKIFKDTLDLSNAKNKQLYELLKAQDFNKPVDAKNLASGLITDILVTTDYVEVVDKQSQVSSQQVRRYSFAESINDTGDKGDLTNVVISKDVIYRGLNQGFDEFVKKMPSFVASLRVTIGLVALSIIWVLAGLFTIISLFPVAGTVLFFDVFGISLIVAIILYLVSKVAFTKASDTFSSSFKFSLLATLTVFSWKLIASIALALMYIFHFITGIDYLGAMSLLVVGNMFSLYFLLTLAIALGLKYVAHTEASSTSTTS